MDHQNPVLPRYAIMTAARNEEKLIGSVIEAVASQTVLPVRWIIVSDGSTDRTEKIVEGYQERHPWISLHRRPPRTERDFAAKVTALEEALKDLEDEEFEVLVNLDADITFPEDYFEFLLGKLHADPRLGVVGTRFTEEGRKIYDHSQMNEQHVSGGCQVFRRECFREVGGYPRLRGGGEDWAAVSTARMLGWKTQSYDERLFEHHRPMGLAGSGFFAAQVRHGERDYLTGGHPVWQIFRCAFQMTRRPYLLGGLGLLFGYLRPFFLFRKPAVSPELVSFHRAEQMKRLRGHLFGEGKAKAANKDPSCQETH